jgi:hypothetical protein
MVTTTFPLVACEGTVVTRLESVQLVTTAGVPLNVTVPGPCCCLNPYPEPLIETVEPTGPEDGESPAMTGVTVKVTPLLAWLFTMTFTAPVVAPEGTLTTIRVSLQLTAILPRAAATAPFTVTTLMPSVAPKPEPVIAIVVPTVPEVGNTLVMLREPCAKLRAEMKTSRKRNRMRCAVSLSMSILLSYAR